MPSVASVRCDLALRPRLISTAAAEAKRGNNTLVAAASRTPTAAALCLFADTALTASSHVNRIVADAVGTAVINTTNHGVRGSDGALRHPKGETAADAGTCTSSMSTTPVVTPRFTPIVPSGAPTPIIGTPTDACAAASGVRPFPLPYPLQQQLLQSTSRPPSPPRRPSGAAPTASILRAVGASSSLAVCSTDQQQRPNSTNNTCMYTDQTPFTRDAAKGRQAIGSAAASLTATATFNAAAEAMAQRESGKGKGFFTPHGTITSSSLTSTTPFVGDGTFAGSTPFYDPLRDGVDPAIVADEARRAEQLLVDNSRSSKAHHHASAASDAAGRCFSLAREPIETIDNYASQRSGGGGGGGGVGMGLRITTAAATAPLPSQQQPATPRGYVLSPQSVSLMRNSGVPVPPLAGGSSAAAAASHANATPHLAPPLTPAPPQTPFAGTAITLAAAGGRPLLGLGGSSSAVATPFGRTISGTSYVRPQSAVAATPLFLDGPSYHRTLSGATQRTSSNHPQPTADGETCGDGVVEADGGDGFGGVTPIMLMPGVPSPPDPTRCPTVALIAYYAAHPLYRSDAATIAQLKRLEALVERQATLEGRRGPPPGPLTPSFLLAANDGLYDAARAAGEAPRLQVQYGQRQPGWFHGARGGGAAAGSEDGADDRFKEGASPTRSRSPPHPQSDPMPVGRPPFNTGGVELSLGGLRGRAAPSISTAASDGASAAVLDVSITAHTGVSVFGDRITPHAPPRPAMALVKVIHQHNKERKADALLRAGGGGGKEGFVGGIGIGAAGDATRLPTPSDAPLAAAKPSTCVGRVPAPPAAPTTQRVQRRPSSAAPSVGLDRVLIAAAALQSEGERKGDGDAI